MKSRLAFYVLLAVLAVISVAMLLPVFVPLIVAMTLAYLLLPLYDRMRGSPDFRAGLLVLLVLFLLILPAILVIIRVADDVPKALGTLDLSAAAQKVNQWMDDKLGRHLPLTENLAVYLARVREAALRATPGVLGAVGSTALSLFVILYSMYYFLRDGRTFWNDFLTVLPLTDDVKPLLVNDLQQTLSGVLFGQFITALVQGLLAGFGFLFFGVPHVLFWTFITMIVGMIPVVGTPVVWLPLAIYLFAAGDRFGGFGLLIWGGVVVMNIDNVLKPRLIAGRARLHPLVALLGVIGGLKLFGVIGFVVGPVLLGVVVGMLRFHREVALRQLEVIETQPS